MSGSDYSAISYEVGYLTLPFTPIKLQFHFQIVCSALEYNGLSLVYSGVSDLKNDCWGCRH